MSAGWAILSATLAGLAAYSWWQAQGLRKVLRQYAGNKIANLAPSEISGTSGRRTESTICFTDMRGFTATAENLPPERVALLLKLILSPALETIRDRGGEIDKIQGDAILYRHAEAESAINIMKDVHSVLEKSSKVAAGRLAILPPQFFSGAHTGPVYLGFVGSKEGFIDYTVLGDSVNVAARLQGLAAKYGVPALISGDTYRAAGKPSSFRLLDVVQVKNRTEPVDIYTQPDDLGAWLLFEEARSLYLSGNFSQAGHLFKSAGFPLFSDRCSLLAATPPSSWTGVWSWTNK